jgi:hypothetical protein
LVELMVVAHVVAGSSPVSHPIFEVGDLMKVADFFCFGLRSLHQHLVRLAYRVHVIVA